MPNPASSHAPAPDRPIDELSLADWRRRIADLYADVRDLIRTDPDAAVALWRREREALFRDATNGAETYPAGRYMLDSAKSADLGGDALRGTLRLDFNFAYQPSCAFDPRWACPLAPPENWLDVPIRAGERIA